MSKPRDERHRDLFQPPLDRIIDMKHPLVRLRGEIDWGFVDTRFGAVCQAGPGHPPLPTQLVAGLLILKHMHNLSDEALCGRWLENPYFQYFCGEESFQHSLPFDRSSLTRWRQRLGEEQLSALLQESLSVAHKTGALAGKDLERVAVDTTVQPKNVAFPTDVRLMHKALVILVRLAKKHDVPLRQSYVRVAKRAAIMAGRYAHAKQFKRFNREVRFLRTRLGRVIRDVRRKTAGDAELAAIFAVPLSRADQVRQQRQRQRGWKLYSLHAPEVECIGKGKARAPYEFGCKVSVATPVTRPKGGPCTAIPMTAIRSARSSPRWSRSPVSRSTASTSTRAIAAHSYENKFRVWISGQVRRVTKTIRREMRRRAAIEPVIGHLKAEHRMGRNYLKGRDGDRANAVLAAAGFNFRLLLRWLEALLRVLLATLIAQRLKLQTK